MSVRKIGVNPEEDLLEDKEYEFKIISGSGVFANPISLKGRFKGYVGQGDQRCANFILKDAMYDRYTFGTKPRCYPLSGFNNKIMPDNVKLILGPNRPAPPSTDERNIPSLTTLARRQLSTNDISNINANYEMPPQSGKLYPPPLPTEGGRKTKKRRNKKNKTKKKGRNYRKNTRK